MTCLTVWTSISLVAVRTSERTIYGYMIASLTHVLLICAHGRNDGSAPARTARETLCTSLCAVRCDVDRTYPRGSTRGSASMWDSMSCDPHIAHHVQGVQPSATQTAPVVLGV